MYNSKIRQSSSIIDSFLDATDGYLSAAMHEQNTEYCEGSLLPDGKLRYEFMMHKDKDFPVYKEYVMRLFEYNHRESTLLPNKDDVLKIFKNEFAALDELVAKCAGNTVEQIVEFVDRYVFAQIERFKKPSSDFQFKDFNWDISTFKWTENDLKEISPSGFNLHHFMESFIFNPNNFRVQEVVASYLRNAPFIKGGETVWYISPEIFITSLSVMTREILEDNKSKLYLQGVLDSLKERQFLNLILNMLGSYGYRPLISKKEYILDG